MQERNLQAEAEALYDRQRAVLLGDDGLRLTRSLMLGGRSYRLSFNPARRRSATARVVDGKVDRPCFLCAAARPAEQESLSFVVSSSGRRYELLVNPFPITERHFTIVAAEHTPQDLAGREADMAELAKALPDYLVFYNGASAGASAPDHFHFQAVPQQAVPMTCEWPDAELAECGVTTMNVEWLRSLVVDGGMCNVACWQRGGRTLCRVVRRTAHRPRQYYLEGDAQVLISPAALEFCGLVPLSRREDFDRMDVALLSDILAQVESREPMVHVGIVDERHIEVTAGARRLSFDYDAMGEGRDVWLFDSPFTIHDVTIGKAFHWEQREDQTFRGSLRILAAGGMLHAINVVPTETYLASVISSEMSATNNVALLKTHAVISRSWLMRQIAPGHVRTGGDDATGVHMADAADAARWGVAPADTYVRWWDHDDHTLYDVCADDHCQRYQGITRQVSSDVATAIAATRGEVLLDGDGAICDARFSKCCGGRSERFSVCWQDTDFHYLQPVDDPWCDTSDERVLRLVLNDYDQATRDFHDWTVSYTPDELSGLVERKLGLGLGDVVELVPLERGESGRIKYLKLVGTRRTVVVGKELVIRKALSESHLYSSAFDVRRDADGSFVIVGRGWGHGVGLCQIGAAAMSQAGREYGAILEHYFAGARLKKLY